MNGPSRRRMLVRKRRADVRTASDVHRVVFGGTGTLARRLFIADDDANATKVAKGTTEVTRRTRSFSSTWVVWIVEGQDWMDYLSHTDITQVVKAKKASDPPPRNVDK
jgi:hypothetical protein